MDFLSQEMVLVVADTALGVMDVDVADGKVASLLLKAGKFTITPSLEHCPHRSSFGCRCTCPTLLALFSVVSLVLRSYCKVKSRNQSMLLCHTEEVSK